MTAPALLMMSGTKSWLRVVRRQGLADSKGLDQLSGYYPVLINITT